MGVFLGRHYHKTKLAGKIDQEIRKDKDKGRKQNRGGFSQAGTPFHEGILHSSMRKKAN